MAPDNRLSPAILDQKWLLTTNHIFTIKRFKILFYLIDFMLICYKKNLTAKADGQFYLHLAFLGPCVTYYVDPFKFCNVQTPLMLHLNLVLIYSPLLFMKYYLI